MKTFENWRRGLGLNGERTGSSHQPVLYGLLRMIDKPEVNEIGVGNFSTPTIIENSFYSEHYETDKEWFEKMVILGSEKHDFYYIDDRERLADCINDYISCFDISFIDGKPAEDRQYYIKLLKDTSKYVIVHDTEMMSLYKYDFSMYKYKWTFKELTPWTTVLSNYDENLVKNMNEMLNGYRL